MAVKAADNKANNLKSITDGIKGIVEAAALECVGVEVERAKEGGTIRVYIDSSDGVSHNECVSASRAVNEYLDRLDEEGRLDFRGAYFVEVSSPGIERPLFTPEHYTRFIGRRAAVTLAARKKAEGEILSYDGDEVTLRISDGSDVRVPFASIKHARLVYDFGDGAEKKKKHK
ncbi:ribosome maturation factor RimP [Synergistales bacterium]|nr:ribosome maturation factor RimP [Synergistales bacterium]